MKLSDVKGERVFDVIADIVDPIANIAEDEQACKMFVTEVLPKGMTARQFLLKKIRVSVPKLCRDHKKDVITIVSSIGNISKKQYVDNLTLTSLMKDFTDLLTDETFMELFISAQNRENFSGSAQEITTVQKA